MDPTCRLLAGGDANHRNSDLAGRCSADELDRRQVTEIVTAEVIERYDGLAVILRHQQESSVHRAATFVEKLMVSPTDRSAGRAAGAHDR